MLRLPEERRHLCLFHGEVRLEQRLELSDHAFRGSGVGQRFERAIAAFEQRVDAMVLFGQASDRRGHGCLLAREVREDARVFHHMMAVERAAIVLPFAAQGFDRRNITGCDLLERRAEACEIPTKRVVCHHQHRRHRRAAVFVQEGRCCGHSAHIMHPI